METVIIHYSTSYNCKYSVTFPPIYNCKYPSLICRFDIFVCVCVHAHDVTFVAIQTLICPYMSVLWLLLSYACVCVCFVFVTYVHVHARACVRVHVRVVLLNFHYQPYAIARCVLSLTNGKLTYTAVGASDIILKQLNPFQSLRHLSCT